MKQEHRGQYVTALIKENSDCIEFLKTFDPCSTIKCQMARNMYLNYKTVQAKLKLTTHADIKKLTFGSGIRRDFTRCSKQRIMQMKSTQCELCGNPLTEILQIHHETPVSLGGSFDEDNLIALCPSCHVLVHKCVDNGGINDGIRDYYAGIEGALEKLETLVKKGIGD